MATKVDVLSDHFVAEARRFHGAHYMANRASMSWGFKAMLKDLSVEQIKALITFYFDHYNHGTHDFKGFEYSYDRLMEAMRDRDNEAEHVEKLKRESAERAKEWREKRERIAGNRSDSE